MFFFPPSTTSLKLLIRELGPLDVGFGNSCTLPRRPIPADLTGSLHTKVKHLTLARLGRKGKVLLMSRTILLLSA